MKLATALAAGCAEPPCVLDLTPQQARAAAASAASGDAPTPWTVQSPTSPAEATVQFAHRHELGTVVTLAVAGVLLGAFLTCRFGERFERLRARHRAAAELRSALVPVIEGLLRTRDEGDRAAALAALRQQRSALAAKLEVLLPMISETRAGHLSWHLSDLEALIARYSDGGLDDAGVEALRDRLQALLRSSYL